MKVIKNNFKPIDDTEQPKEITCPSCESILQYKREDLTEVFWRTEGWTNSNIKYKGFRCPCCQYQIGIVTLYP